MKIIKNTTILCFAFQLLVMTAEAELVAIEEADLKSVSGQAGITINAKIKFGEETNFVYTNTSGKTLDDPTLTAADKSYLVVNKISGDIEIKGLSIDLISNLNNSGKAALQWTLPKSVKLTNLRTKGIYASNTETIPNITTSDQTFLLAVKANGTLTLPSNTQISAFVVD
jgi:hypothetical protein